jgi:hypothetical protein
LVGELHHWLTDELAVYHIPIDFRQMLDALDDDVGALHVETGHLHESVGHFTEIYVIVEDSLHFDALEYDVLHVLDSCLLPPSVVGGSGAAHDYLGVIGHQLQHGAQHVFPNVLIVEVDLLAFQNHPEIPFKVSSSELVSRVVSPIIDGILATNFFCRLAFLVTTGNAVDIGVTHFGEILGDCQSNAASY